MPSLTNPCRSVKSSIEPEQLPNRERSIPSCKSVCRLLPTAVPQKAVEHILRVSAGAPSGHNVQPWRAYAVAGAARRQGLHTCPQAAFAWFHKIVQAHLPLAEHEILSCAIALGHEDPSAPENACITERAAVGDFASFHGFD